MKKTSFSLLIFLMLLNFTALTQNFKEEYDSSKVYIQKNNFNGAIPWLEKAKNTVKTNPLDTAAYLEILRLLSISYAKTGKNAEAQNYFVEASSVYVQVPSKRAQFVTHLSNFGVFLYNQKKYAEAIQQFEKALALKQNIAGENNTEYQSILNNLSSCYMGLKQLDKAEKSYEQLLKLRESLAGTSHPEYLVTCQNLANVYNQAGKQEKAVSLYEAALKGIQGAKGEKSKEYITVLGQLASVYRNQGNYEKAEGLYKKSLDLYGEVNEKATKESGKIMLDLASIYVLQGKFDEAEKIYTQALTVFKENVGEFSADYASVLNNIGLFYAEAGKFDLAESFYKQSLEIGRQTIGEKHPDNITTYNNLGLTYKATGKFDLAEATLKRAVKYWKDIKSDKTAEYATAINNLGGLYEILGRPDEAEEAYSEALSILKSGSGVKTILYATTLNNLAGIYETIKKYDKAENAYNEALSVIKDVYGENHAAYAAALNNLAVLQEAMGKKQAALKLYKQNLETTKATLGERHPNFAISLNNYGVLLESMGNYVEAEKVLVQALNLKKDILGEKHPAYTNSLYDIAKHYTAVKNFQQADVYWDKALSNYLYEIDAYFPSMSEKEKTKFYQTIAPRFEQFNSYVLLRLEQNQGVTGKMYNYQLATKALLLNATNKVRQRILSSKDFILIDKYKKWNDQKELIAKATNMSKEELKEQNINLNELVTSTNDLEKELSASSEIFRNAHDNDIPSWQDVQKKLRSDEAAMEIIRFTKYSFDSSGYFLADSIYYAALVITPSSKSGPEIVVLKNGTELEKQYLKYYRNAIKNRVEDEFSYTQYWSRLKKPLTGIKTLYFSPDGVYNSISLNGLKNTKANTFLSDEINVNLVTNTKDLLENRPNQNPNKEVVLVGNPDFASAIRNLAANTKGISQDQASYIERAGSGVLEPLPGTKIEVEKIGDLLAKASWKTTILTEQEAAEEKIKSVQNPKVLHIATHGFFDEDGRETKNSRKPAQFQNPLFKSGLLMAGASLSLLKQKNDNINFSINNKSKEDGILTAYEAMNLNLDQTDLVILSACETGRGEIKNGEGVYGLQRALKVAGAKCIILSLWTVNDDATQKLMTYFYQEWLKSGDKKIAFKIAQKNLRKDFPHPYYWAAFIMVGG